MMTKRGPGWPHSRKNKSDRAHLRHSVSLEFGEYASPAIEGCKYFRILAKVVGRDESHVTITFRKSTWARISGMLFGLWAKVLAFTGWLQSCHWPSA